MKITTVETFLLRHDLARPTGPSIELYTARDALIVKVSTDQGLVGWGETSDIGGARAVIREYPEFPRPRITAAASLAQLGRVDEARAMLETSIEMLRPILRFIFDGPLNYRPEDHEHRRPGSVPAGPGGARLRRRRPDRRAGRAQRARPGTSGAGSLHAGAAVRRRAGLHRDAVTASR